MIMLYDRVVNIRYEIQSNIFLHQPGSFPLRDRIDEKC